MSGASETAKGDEVVCRVEASATAGSGLWFLIVFGVIGALTAMLVSIALPIGPWWLWLGAIVPFVLLGRWELRRSAVVIELRADGAGLRLRVSGPGARPAIDEPIEKTYDHWATAQRIPIRQGGGTMMHFSVVVKTERGRPIGFRQMGGSDPLDWPERSPRLGDGADMFATLNLFALEKALRARATAR